MTYQFTVSEKTAIFFISLLGPTLAFFLIKTEVVKILFVAACLVLILLLLFDTSSTNIKIKIRIGLRKSLYMYFSRTLQFFPYIIGVLASLIVLLTPEPFLAINGEPWGVLNTFISLPVCSIFRIISAYYLTSLFPGIIFCSSILQNERVENVEKLGLMLAVSFCYTVLIGLILIFLKIFSIGTYLLSLWILILGLIVFRINKDLRAKHARSLKVEPRSYKDKLLTNLISIDLISLTPFVVGVLLVVSAYFSILSGAPLSMVAREDIMTTINSAHEFVYFNPTFSRSSLYIGHAAYIWVTGTIAGLPKWYAYVGTQFFHFVFPIGFYTLVRTIFPNKRNIAAIATVLAFFGYGLSGLITAEITSSSVHYVFGIPSERYYVLASIWEHIAGPLYPAVVETEHFDALIFFALAFSYKYITESNGEAKKLLISLLLILTALLTHTIFTFPIFMLTILFFSIFANIHQKRLLILTGSIIGLTFLLDPISKFIFGNFWIPVLFQGWSKVYWPVVESIILFFITYVLLYACRKKWIALVTELRHKVQFSFSGFSSKRIFKKSVIILSITIFLYAVFLFTSNFESIQAWMAWETNPKKLLPWYWFVVNTFGVIFPLAIASIVYLKRERKTTTLYLLSFTMSMCLPIIASFMYPELLIPPVWFVRYMGFLLFPLSILASVSIYYIILSLKFDWKRICTYILLTITVSFAILSHAYFFERIYLGGQLGNSMAPELTDALNFINTHLYEAAILPLSEKGEQLLTNLGRHMYVLPVFREYAPTWLSYPWVHDLLIRSTPHVVLYALNKIGAEYIFAFKEEISTIPGLKYLPTAYENSLVSIYEVPKNHLYKGSSLTVVYPTLDEPRNFQDAFNLATHLETNFSLINDLDLEELKEENVYIFSDNLRIPRQIYNNFFTAIHNGAHVIFLNPQFASANELDYPTDLNLTQSLNITIRLDLSQVGQWSIYSGEGVLAFNAGEGLYAEHSRAADRGEVCYEYTFPKPLNLEHGDIIRISFKTNSTGEFFLVLVDGSKPSSWFAWLTKYDKRYKLFEFPSDLNKWISLEFPIDEPTWKEGLNITNIGSIQVGLMDLEPNQNIRFQVGDIQFLSGNSTITFFDGNEYKFESFRLERRVTPLYQGHALANYSLLDGEQSPLIWSTELGNGSFTFIDTEPLQKLDPEDYNEILQHIANTVKRLLPPAASLDELYSLPYHQDIFEYLVPHPLTLRFKQGLQNSMFWYDTINMRGNIVISSDKCFLYKRYVQVKDFVIETKSSELMFENKSIQNIMVKGEFYISANNSEVEGLNKSAGHYAFLRLKNFSSCDLTIRNAEIAFETEIQGELKKYNFPNANMTFEIVESFEIVTKQPMLTVEGVIEGLAQGTIRHDNFYYTPVTENVGLAGSFALKIMYQSGLIYSKIFNVKKINALSGFIEENG